MPDGDAHDPDQAHAPVAHRLEVEVGAERAELVAAVLWGYGATGVWERPGALVAWFPAEGSDPPALEGAAPVPELRPDRRRWRLEPDRDWQAEWKATIAVVRAGRVTVVPSWLAADHRAAPGEVTLVLDPGRAFGSGHHATTTLCLELLDALESRDGLRGRTVADVGCGTGVLGIAAARWGAEVTAVDIDPDAVVVTRENARRNDITLTATTGSVDRLRGPADVVVANLVTDTIVELADELVAATRDTLIVSGIARERSDRALGALAAAGAGDVEVRERDGWIAARLEPGHQSGGGR